MAAVLERTPGVLSTSINATRTQVTVVRKGEERRDADLAESVEREGFGATVIPSSDLAFAIGAEHLADARILLGKTKGVLRVSAGKEPAQLVVTVDTRHTDAAKLAAALLAAEIPARAAS